MGCGACAWHVSQHRGMHAHVPALLTVGLLVIVIFVFCVLVHIHVCVRISHVHNLLQWELL